VTQDSRRLKFHAVGHWKTGRVQLSRAATSSRRIVPEIERLIEETWRRETSRPGVHLFDGPMCRLESFGVSHDALKLAVSQTSYKPFTGTNLHNTFLAGKFGPDVMANPLGVSTVLETADGFLLLGRRNAAVAYYPCRVHPFAGTIEPADGVDAFNAVRRELSEELQLSQDELIDIRCTGLVEDQSLLQPELIFATKCALSREQVEGRVDKAEHDALWASSTNPEELIRALDDQHVTPVGVASLLLWARLDFGEDWFDGQSSRFRA
jgi:8-oxo-dGTP pyrophosphatase MutT (NUDIX family)